MKHLLSPLLCCFALLMVAGLSGCGNKPIRHLSSDACLIAQGTTKKDVVTYMGVPSVKRKTDTGEEWVYIQEHKSPLKKTPVVNWFFGTVTYDLVYIIFTGDIVTNCQYRSATEEEFAQFSLATAQDPAVSQ